MVDRLTLRSYAREPVGFDVELELDADFLPMLEVRGLATPATRIVRRRATSNGLRFSAVGVDGRERSTTVTCPGAAPADGRRLRAVVDLEPGEARTLEVRFALAEENGTTIPPGGDDAAAVEGSSVSRAGAAADAWLADRPRVEVDDDLFDRVLRRSLLDLRLLASSLDGHRYFAAGVPWYATLFGRDSVITALETIAFDPGMAEETLRLLAGRLGTRVDDEHDEEPG